jgi:hypothetical protein
MNCWLWDLVTGDLTLAARSTCWWIVADPLDVVDGMFKPFVSPFPLLNRMAA